MSHSLHLKIAPERRLAMTQALRQSLEILRMPQIELAQWLQKEIEENPLLEELPRKALGVPLPEVATPFNFHVHILSQIREAFPLDEQRGIAQQLLELMDERGFIPRREQLALMLQKPLAAILSVLEILQTFDPPGIFAQDLQESLILQLQAQGEGSSDASLLIRDHFQDFLQGRFTRLQKKIGEASLKNATHKIARLRFRLIDRGDPSPLSSIFPDLRISHAGELWKIEIDEKELPVFQIHAEYASLKPSSREEEEALRLWHTSAKWLLRSLKRRREILAKIGAYLVQAQSAYLALKGNLRFLTLQEIASHLSLHESTLSRAISGKYALTPRGTILLRSLVSSSPEMGEAKEELAALIQKENKASPLTDEELAQALKEKGFPLARRTVSKYRTLLKIGSASARKHLSK